MDSSPSLQSGTPRQEMNLIYVVIGMVIVIASIWLVFWNEGVGLHGVKPVRVAGFDVITVPNAPVDIANNNKLIYTHGAPLTNAIMQDPLFGFSDKVMKLQRKVEMYQWSQTQESQKVKLANGTDKETVVYTYKPVWSKELIDSNAFKDSVGHRNPLNVPLDAVRGKVQDANVGDFKLSPELIDAITAEIPIDLSGADLTLLQQRFKTPVQHDGQYVYIGADPKSPAIGDLRVSLVKGMPQEISIIAVQRDAVLYPMVSADGKPMVLVMEGHILPADMIQKGSVKNNYLPWVFRFCALLGMGVGMYFFLNGLAVSITRLPLLGSLLSVFGFNALCFGLAFGLWAVAMIIAWAVVKPLFAVVLFIITIVIYIMVFKRYQRARTAL